MEIDSVSAYHQTLPAHELASKSSGHYDNMLFDILRGDIEAVKEGKHGSLSAMGRKSCGETEPTQYDNTPEQPHSYVRFEDSIKSGRDVDECMEAPYSPPTNNIRMFEKENDYYTDKTVTETELPVVKDGAYRTVKDICIDEGVHSLEKVMLESNDDKAISSTFKYLVSNENCVLNREMTDDAAHGLKSSLLNEHTIVVVDKDEHCPSRSSLSDGKLETGLHFLDEILPESNADDKISSKSNPLLSNGNYDPNKEVTHSTMPGLKSSSVNEHHIVVVDKDTMVQFVSGNTGGKLEIGLHSLEKNPVISSDDYKMSLMFNHSVSNGHYDLKKEMTDCDTQGSKSSSVNVHPFFVDGKDAADQCASGSVLTGGKLETTNELVGDISIEMTSENQLILLQEFETNPRQVDSSRFDCINDQKQFIGQQKTDQDTLEGENFGAISEPSAAKETHLSYVTKGNPADVEAEGGVITFHFDSKTATVSGGKDTEDNTDNQQSRKAQNVPKAQETLNGATTSPRSSFVLHDNVDSNFFGPASLSIPIASSGHIPYSGSISLRSDSSTTSARSFAFPVLQSEWNCSPVKMAKADRRRLRKHRSWPMGLLCCRF